MSIKTFEQWKAEAKEYIRNNFSGKEDEFDLSDHEQMEAWLDSERFAHGSDYIQHLAFKYDTPESNSITTERATAIIKERNQHPPFRLHETIADIAYIAGTRRYYSGDSRADMQNFIFWAEQFEKVHAKTDWDSEDKTYMEAIEEYTNEKIKGHPFIPYQSQIELYNDLIDGDPQFHNAVYSPVYNNGTDIERCEPGKANMHSVYLCLTDGRQMTVADTDNPQVAQQLQKLLQQALKIAVDR
jgi:hypothetical protein